MVCTVSGHFKCQDNLSSSALLPYQSFKKKEGWSVSKAHLGRLAEELWLGTDSFRKLDTSDHKFQNTKWTQRKCGKTQSVSLRNYSVLALFEYPSVKPASPGFIWPLILGLEAQLAFLAIIPWNDHVGSISSLHPTKNCIST